MEAYEDNSVREAPSDAHVAADGRGERGLPDASDAEEGDEPAVEAGVDGPVVC